MQCCYQQFAKQGHVVLCCLQAKRSRGAPKASKPGDKVRACVFFCVPISAGQHEIHLKWLLTTVPLAGFSEARDPALATEFSASRVLHTCARVLVWMFTCVIACVSAHFLCHDEHNKILTGNGCECLRT